MNFKQKEIDFIYISQKSIKGVLTFEDGQEFDEVRIPFKQVYVSDNPLTESFDVELNPGMSNVI